MARTALAIRHVQFEDLGVLAAVLEHHGYRVRYLDAGVQPIDAAEEAADLLVVLGGPIGVADVDAYPFLGAELAVLRSRIEQQLPVLGVCLGAQLIAAAQGATVSSTGGAEIGYAPITLPFAGPANPLEPLGDVPVLHWHGDRFEVPPGARSLASTPVTASQAFSIDHGVLALQFHLEAHYRRIERWLIGHAHELSAHGIDPAGIREDAGRYGPELARRATTVFDTWLEGVRSAA